jgi:hypothetical protein
MVWMGSALSWDLVVHNHCETKRYKERRLLILR